MEVNAKLKKYIEEHGIKIVFIAQKTGIARERLSRMLNNKSTLSASDLKKISDALGVEPNIFLG